MNNILQPMRLSKETETEKINMKNIIAGIEDSENV